MATNSQILSAFYGVLHGSSLGYPISWPGYNFTPPSQGFWLEVSFLPNRGVDDRLADDGHVSPQGILQITVCGRPGDEVALREVAEEVQQVLPKGTPILPPLRVTRSPYTLSVIYAKDRMMLPVSVEYTE